MHFPLTVLPMSEENPSVPESKCQLPSSLPRHVSYLGINKIDLCSTYSTPQGSQLPR